MVSENDETWFEVGEAALNVLAQCRLGNQVVTFADRLAEKTSEPSIYASLQTRVAWPLWYMGHVKEIIQRAELIRQDEVTPSIRAEIDTSEPWLSRAAATTAQRTRQARWRWIGAARLAFRLRKPRRCVRSPRHR